MSRLDQLKKLVQIAGDDPISHYGLGLEYLNLSQFDEAAAAFRAAIGVNAQYSAAYYQLGRALISAGKLEEAQQTLTTGKTIARGAGDWHTEGEMQALLDTIT